MRISSRSPAQGVQTVDFTDSSASASHKVLRNTYMLLSITLLFSAMTAAATIAFAIPGPGMILTLVGYFGLLFATTKLRNSAWGIGAVFALTGFMGYSLGPILTRYLGMPGGTGIVMTAMAMTGLIFFGLSAYVLISKRDFSFIGGFLMIGMIVALVASLGAIFFQIPALSLTISAVMVLLMSGMILFETSNIINGGETNYIMATVSLYVTIFNLFTSLLQLLGFVERD
ncbi:MULTISPECIES: Bax inhibitor-1/YccA family protein [unclassified Undibacterium]|uniref:Bax inhibitor-1/YccA family protein n=1 Tax=unclassified Undibacterium TaxID=2630295 RepID=UPI002AC94DAB|nr:MULTISPECIES: Bax inhibitor-1/YccA family protein [unclassified Undibacterium]MEB0137776.1 Bax inhibitor-1/YccA family protein [Undibacterium sp. CCC2.1]MEB0171033.1 Bax inhibitor-1/YccA family protein [Undibacterium sp. CCC1.1]MEB0175078.1 Bax inhibitor-1/YccA family protein [Undibacterium sp. CCC3.4]MEB0215144.1 Bax inhibitor-1/YccA family protein [Undibacterium sp. 5I2]WPX44882.1 Bax inhibitor-1/YccA family protein [Undibacterium sp. CCC3.4]